ncbi:lysine/ornithine N-monooxygenase [Undibacterium sp. GrIS 1.2]
MRGNILASDGISADTLRTIYQKMYTRRFIDGERDVISMLPNRRVISRSAVDKQSALLTQHKGDGSKELVHADTVIFATGYRNAHAPLSDRLTRRLDWEGDEIRVGADYAAQWDAPRGQGLFIQNATRNQKGLADPNLSLMAWRSRQIADAILGRKQQVCNVPSFVNWRGDDRSDAFLKSA